MRSHGGEKEATRSSDRRRNGGFGGVMWPLLEIIDAQPTLVYKHTGAKRLMFPRENSYSIPLISLSRKVELCGRMSGSNLQRKGYQQNIRQHPRGELQQH